ncbi:hypothetical protein [Companilactobacillus alimentarius]|uniref:Uncharacterized protein n=1 Tax=Companilactobacillus alimentarius DSM 20249 TaxID=1423720 RepID=A0A2K9HI70_9LACO|nr:hypothetical protein [Companilactobacillus alimentarius]AUI72251.1 hypothetical protein LA20249_08680 [Companilactobacillus alimentarius DSM 20249]KRK77526.1 hypothetical protein FC67_GL000280 [Companilactobacillus alimentarius DSM 20249]GEO45475.1 hypothetical protein LAL01_17070 [Companilactobacillus alimentarius]
MKKLYKLDRISVLGIFLIYLFMTIIKMLVADQNVAEMPQMGRYLKLGIFALVALIAFGVFYWVYTLLLKNNDHYKVTLLVNMSLCLAFVALLGTIVYLIAGKTNIWVSGIVGAIGFGGLGLLNWESLDVPQADKIKISVLTVIGFILTLV